MLSLEQFFVGVDLLPSFQEVESALLLLFEQKVVSHGVIADGITFEVSHERVHAYGELRAGEFQYERVKIVVDAVVSLKFVRFFGFRNILAVFEFDIEP